MKKERGGGDAGHGCCSCVSEIGSGTGGLGPVRGEDGVWLCLGSGAGEVNASMSWPNRSCSLVKAYGEVAPPSSNRRATILRHRQAWHCIRLPLQLSTFEFGKRNLTPRDNEVAAFPSHLHLHGPWWFRRRVSTGDRVLVVLEEQSEQAKYSAFLKDLTGKSINS